MTDPGGVLAEGLVGLEGGVLTLIAWGLSRNSVSILDRVDIKEEAWEDILGVELCVELSANLINKKERGKRELLDRRNYSYIVESY